MIATIPELDLDLYSDDTLANTCARYRSMRDRAPIVHLPANAMYAVTTYDAVRAALRADDVLISGRGVCGNALLNDDRTPTEITLSSDGETHKRRRAVLTVSVTPAAMRDIQGKIARYADELIVSLAQRRDFCVVNDFAAHLPLSIVADLVGLSDYAKSRMLEWAAATFNVMGGMNERTRASSTRACGSRRRFAALRAMRQRRSRSTTEPFRRAHAWRCCSRAAIGTRANTLNRMHFGSTAIPDHLSWGHGVHACAGKHLARLEMEQLALALSRHARTLQVGEPEPLMNNVLQGFAALPAQIQ